MTASWLGAAEAEAMMAEHLGQTPRAAHSRAVAAAIAELAASLGEDQALWRTVGLLHDIDYFAVDGDWTRHGVLAAEWLAGRLPPAALNAIAAHDHRAGVAGEGTLAAGLRLADALAVLDQQAGRTALLEAYSFVAWRQLAAQCGRPFLAEMITIGCLDLELDLAALEAVLRAMPPQEPAE